MSKDYVWGSRHKSWTDKNLAKYRKEFDLAYRVNKGFVESYESHEPDVRSQQELVLCSFASRISGLFEGVILLAKNGMQTEAKIVCRTLLEAIFKFAAISKDSSLTHHYVAESDLEGLHLIKKLRRNPIQELKPKNLDELESEMKKRIEQNKPKGYDCSFWAEKAGLTTLYLSQYTVLSHAVHSKVHDLQETVHRNSDGLIEAILNGPTERGFEEVFVSAMHSILVAYHAFCGVFNLNIHGKSQEIFAKEFETYLANLPEQ